jgi:hypothetical protein
MDNQKVHIVEVVVAPAIPPDTAINLDILQEELRKIPGVTRVAELATDELRIHFNHAEYRHTFQSMRVAVYTAYSRAAERTLQRAPTPTEGPR